MSRMTALSAESAAGLYVIAKMGSGEAISSAAAVRALRALLGDCKLTDHELVALVVHAALAEGLIVNFDGAPEDKDFSASEMP